MAFQSILDDIKAIAIKLEAAIGLLAPVVETLAPEVEPIIEGVEEVIETVEKTVADYATVR